MYSTYGFVHLYKIRSLLSKINKMVCHSLRYIYLLSVFLFSGCLDNNEKKVQNEEKPFNVLFLAVDDLRPQLGAYGHDYMVTPNMDRLAMGGRLFRHHYVIVPTCGPSRYALMTGQYPKSTEEINNRIFYTKTAGEKGVRKNEIDRPESMAEAFRRNGYYTVGLGKISHSADGFVYGYTDSVSNVMELPNSWDEFHFDAGKWGNGWNAFFGYASGENRQSLNKEVKPYESGEVDDEGYPDGLTAKLAVSQLGELKERPEPFFLAVGFFKPHLPFTAPQKYWDLYDEESLPITKARTIPENTNKASFQESGEFNQYKLGEEKAGLDHELSTDYARKIRHAYFAATSYVDAQVGKVIDALEKNGLDDNTIIVLWGDHGWHLGDERVWGKHTLSEYALRSALIIKSPDQAHPGQPTDAIVESTDIYSTLMDLTGQPIPDYLEGQSLKPIMEDPDSKVDQTAFSYFRKGISMRVPRFRITRYFRKEEPRVELYDYQNDPYETRNIAGNHPDLVDSLLVKWEEGNTGLYGN